MGDQSAQQDGGVKRKAPEADAPPAKRPPVSEDLLKRRYTKRVFEALRDNGDSCAEAWGACTAVLDEVCAEGCAGTLLLALCGVLAEVLDDAGLRLLAEYMQQPKRESLWNTREISSKATLIPLSLAIKSVSTRGGAIKDASAAGGLPLLTARKVDVRADVSVSHLSHAGFKSNEGLGYTQGAKAPKEVDTLNSLYTALSTSHEVTLPDAAALAESIRSLQELSQQLVAGSVNKEDSGKRLKGLVETAEAQVTKLLDACSIISATKDSAAAQHLSDAAAKHWGPQDVAAACDCPTPRVHTGVWDAVNLSNTGYRLFLLLLADVVLGTLLRQTVDVVATVLKGASASEPVAKSLLALRTKVLKAVDAVQADAPSIPSGRRGATWVWDDKASPSRGVFTTWKEQNARLSDSLRHELWRECGWATWKARGAHGLVFDGVAAAGEDLDQFEKGVTRGARMSKRIDESGRDPSNSARRLIPQSKRTSAKPAEATHETALFPAAMLQASSTAWALDLPFPAKPAKADITELSGADTVQDVWVASRALVADHMSAALEDDTYYLTDAEKLDSVRTKVRAENKKKK